MVDDEYNIVFERIADIKKSEPLRFLTEDERAENDAIQQLQRIVMEVTEENYIHYTST